MSDYAVVDIPVELTVYKGEKWDQQLGHYAGATGEEVAVNLTGIGMICQIRNSVSSSDVLFTLSTEAGTITLDTPESGLFTLHLTSAQTKTLCPRNVPVILRIDIFKIESEEYRPFLEGSLKAIPWATRDWEDEETE